jgi:hypothetical protein
MITHWVIIGVHKYAVHIKCVCNYLCVPVVVHIPTPTVTNGSFYDRAHFIVHPAHSVHAPHTQCHCELVAVSLTHSYTSNDHVVCLATCGCRGGRSSAATTGQAC